jgi:alginate O-acetyltransferase complex protein AlgI
MLFNSFEFIFLFLPVTWVLFWILMRWTQPRFALTWLVVSSLFFYGWWSWKYVFILVGSAVVNFGISQILFAATRGAPRRRLALIIGIAANLTVLGYFKYANFFIDNLRELVAVDWNLGAVILPLGISFYTFQQIAYLVDVYRDVCPRYTLLQYLGFVTFFPHCIAGPLTHPQELLPQMAELGRHGRVARTLVPGLLLFAVGLLKKTAIADSLSPSVATLFNFVSGGGHIGVVQSWAGALAYTMQLYFDFSGYSDMACGLALMFGLRLPVNFLSPYKAANIIDFWRRWHVTLSRFLRTYLYYSLGGNRKGPARRYVNLIITMLLGGLWHGAAWTFVIWGGLHGLYLVINHAWRHLPLSRAIPRPVMVPLAWFITFAAVNVAWVVFRAPDLATALRFVGSMFGAHGLSHSPREIRGALAADDLMVIFGATLAALILPNMPQVLQRWRLYCNLAELDIAPLRSAVARILIWRPTVWWSVAAGAVLAAGIMAIAPNSEFLYFDF